MFTAKDYGKIKVYKSTLLEKFNGIDHLFTTRLGGVSPAPYDSMNLGLTRGDLRENVIENYTKTCAVLKVDISRVVLSAQTHDDRIEVVTSEHSGTGLFKKAFDSADALITTEKNLALVLFFADCVPVYFFDSVKKVAALAHAGWKGTEKKIAKKVVDKMISDFGCKASDIVCAIGPSIGPCHFEVSSDVANRLITACGDTVVEERENLAEGKRYINLWQANKNALLEAGIKEQNLSCAEICTYCKSDQFFSHRKLGDKRGNMAAVMVIKA